MKSFHDRFFITYLKSRKAQSMWNLGRRVIFCNTIKEITFDGFKCQVEIHMTNGDDEFPGEFREYLFVLKTHTSPASALPNVKMTYSILFLAMFGHGLEASICIPLCLWNAMHFCPYRQDKSEILFTFRQFASQHVPSFRLKLALKSGCNKTFMIIFKR